MSFTLPRFDLGICYFDNPLRVDADLLELAVAGQKLNRSPFARVWDLHTAEQFKGKAGLWVTCHGPVAQLISGLGSPSELVDCPGPREQCEDALFLLCLQNLLTWSMLTANLR